MYMINLFKSYKKSLIVIFTIIIIENIAWIIEPTLFGYVIDEFINKSYSRSLHFQEHHMQVLILWIYYVV